jgi:hypothetical protein
MKNVIYFFGATLFALTSCQKTVETNASPAPVTVKASVAVPYVKYTIEQGQQFCNNNNFIAVQYDELKFNVKFDSSAIYYNINPANQGDINKLFGFSDNNSQHHLYSARFGWNWGKSGLCLHAYVYNNGVRTSKLLGAVKIGEENACSIKVTSNSYIFTLNGKIETMPRESTTAKAMGYKLYPYFGGDEFAPHQFNIWIREL